MGKIVEKLLLLTVCLLVSKITPETLWLFSLACFGVGWFLADTAQAVYFYYKERNETH